jgi:glycosyltransferase involved in cell wall biosynthesis
VLITCIIPTRNRPDYIAESAASVLAQDHSDLELIIVNDGEIAVPDFGDGRVRVLNSGQAGAVPARNLGASQAGGDAIAWLDDDDQWTDKYFLSACAKCLGATSDFVFGDGTLVFPDGARKAFAKNASPESLMRDNTILISAVCYRRSLHQSLGMFDEALPYYWDWDWYLRVARAEHLMTRLVTPVVDIRIHENNMSGQANAEARAKNLQALRNKHGLPEIRLKSHIDFVDSV